jgi:hypothetical protein
MPPYFSAAAVPVAKAVSVYAGACRARLTATPPTVTGDAPCLATDQTYRTDTAAARAFLANFVTLP